MIHRYDCLKVCLAGQDIYDGGHSIDPHRIHHRVLEAALEYSPGTNMFCGIDGMKNTTISFSPY